jgi:hypothetical protein
MVILKASLSLIERGSKMKNLNVVITDDSDTKLEKIMDEKRFKNRADALDWIIQTAHDFVFGKGAESLAPLRRPI